MRTIITTCVLFFAIVSILSAQWERIDGNLGLLGTYQPSLAAADATYLYQLVIVGSLPEIHLYRSSDDGTTWSRMSAFPPATIAPRYFRVLANGRLVAGSPDNAMTSAVMLFSDDQGMSWQEVRTTASVDVQDMEWVGGNIYLGAVRAGQMIRSTDGGETWEVAQDSPSNVGLVRAVGADVIALSGAGMGVARRSSDGGASWDNILLDGSQKIVTTIWRAGNVLLLKQLSGNTWASTDGGATWSPRSGAQSDIATFFAATASPDGMKWIMGGNGIYFTTDAGATATEVTAGLPKEDETKLCGGGFTVTNFAAHFAGACGSYRYAFSGTAAVRRADAGTDALSLAVTPAEGTWGIQFTLPSAADVRITVHDQNGRCVATVLDGDYDAGSHVTRFDADVLPDGIYWVRAESDGASVTRKMVVVN